MLVAIEPFTARLPGAAYCIATDVAEAFLDRKKRWQVDRVRFSEIHAVPHASVARQPIITPNTPGGSTLPTANADKADKQQ